MAGMLFAGPILPQGEQLAQAVLIPHPSTTSPSTKRVPTPKRRMTLPSERMEGRLEARQAMNLEDRLDPVDHELLAAIAMQSRKRWAQARVWVKTHCAGLTAGVSTCT